MTTKIFDPEKEHISDRMILMLHILRKCMIQIHYATKAVLKFIMILLPQPPE